MCLPLLLWLGFSRNFVPLYDEICLGGFVTFLFLWRNIVGGDVNLEKWQHSRSSVEVDLDGNSGSDKLCFRKPVYLPQVMPSLNWHKTSCDPCTLTCLLAGVGARGGGGKGKRRPRWWWWWVCWGRCEGRMAGIYCRLLLTAVVLGASIIVPATANFNLYLTQAEVRRILGRSQHY